MGEEGQGGRAEGVSECVSVWEGRGGVAERRGRGLGGLVVLTQQTLPDG